MYSVYYREEELNMNIDNAKYLDKIDISSDLSDRIRNTLPSFTGLSSFCDLLKSKDMTYTRISRCLNI